MRRLARIFFFVGYAFGASQLWAASPCDGVNRNLASERRSVLAPAIAKQLKVSRVSVNESMQFGGWSIIYVGTFESDDVFLFYAKDPLTSSPVTTWGGVALRSEEPEIRSWTLKNAPGIPQTLANCFAWHVTKDSR
jgi:hypothetical protein